MPVLRILAADVLALERTSSTAWTLRGHLVAIVQLTGMVVEAAASGKLDDGSGVSIPVIQWLPRNLANADPVEFARCVNVPALGTYLSVTGKISEHRGERQIVASHIETLNDGLSAGILDVLLALRSRKILAVTKPKPAAVHALQQALLDPERRKKWQGRHILAFHTLIRDDHIVGLVRALQQPTSLSSRTHCTKW
ncbi:hypothetical protein BC828DRAFT_407412 [Blastocladiella britannica]|nr:hypothetical protein BC828DRAFT_407412 [Blastocladiella britannica]